ncbi:MAG: hypothetical protein EBW87_00730 [Burkholderiaceae bacterium]|jgi:hypothetical protein|nr:hypothetical protein [Burkholderiaceae bacterium]
MSIATFRLAREQEEARLSAAQQPVEAEAEPVACPAPVVDEEPKKAPATAPKTKTTASKS